MIAAMQSARVAVVVPVLDELRQLPALAAELGRLRDAGAEIVVVDGGSRDGTRAALDALDLAVIGAPRGRATQMNAGARATSAPVLLFLHADTRLPDGALDAVAAAIDGGAAGGCFRVRIESRDPRLAVAARIINLRSRLLPSASGDQAIFADRAAFDRIGGYRELALCEDLDFVARLSRQGRFVCLDGEVTTSARRWQAHGVSRTIALMWALRLGYHLGVSPRLLARWYGDAR
jgi:rSAM/selenodomain-associated transferase 2